MTSYRVVPNKGDWKVMKGRNNSSNHRTVSEHLIKRTAEKKARRLASPGDRLVILRGDGAIQKSVVVA